MPNAVSVDKSGDRVRQMFGEISSRYDFMNHFLSGGTDIYWRWLTVSRCPPEGPAPILDVCTGTGDLALAYWKKAKGQVEVVGTDFTPEMLRIAEQKQTVLAPEVADLARSSVDRLAPMTFREADTQHLPFASDRFQLVTVAFGLRNVSSTEQGVREMIRVCQPGGRVAILEFSMPSNPLFGSLYAWYFRNVLPRLGQLFAKNRQAAYSYLPASVAEFPYGQDLADRLTAWGLEAVEFTPLTFGIATLYVGRKPRTGSGATPASGALGTTNAAANAESASLANSTHTESL